METIKNILTAILKWLGSIPSDKLLHLIAGAVIAAFFALVIPYTAEICVLFAAIAGVAKEAFDQYRYKGWDWLDLAYTMAGGLWRRYCWMPLCPVGRRNCQEKI